MTTVTTIAQLRNLINSQSEIFANATAEQKLAFETIQNSVLAIDNQRKENRKARRLAKKGFTAEQISEAVTKVEKAKAKEIHLDNVIPTEEIQNEDGSVTTVSENGSGSWSAAEDLSDEEFNELEAADKAWLNSDTEDDFDEDDFDAAIYAGLENDLELELEDF